MSPEASETLELLERARQGDGAAVAELFARHRDRVHQTVALRLDRRLAARIDVSDVVQDTCLEASRRLSEFLHRQPLPFGLWLAWLARERVAALHRQHLFRDRRAIGREVPGLPAESSAYLTSALFSPGPTPSQAATAAEAVEKLRQALGLLDDDERDLVLWRHFEQLTNREIAQLLGVSEAAAAKRYIRAVERLRGVLNGLGVHDPA